MNKILIIEDDEAISDLLADILGKFGEIIVADSEIAALKCLQINTFNLIISDYYLGDSNGLDIVKKIHESIGEIPVILISAYPTVDMLANGINLKIYSFLQKPLNIDELLSKIESLLIFDLHYVFGKQRAILVHSTLTMTVDAEVFELTEIQFKMMKYFFENLDKVIDRDKMIGSIWGTRRISSENTLDTHLLNLKKKVPFIRDHLRTLPRIGYVFSSEIK